MNECEHLWALRGEMQTAQVASSFWSEHFRRWENFYELLPTHNVFFCQRCLATRNEPKPEWDLRYPVGPATRKAEQLAREHPTA